MTVGYRKMYETTRFEYAEWRKSDRFKEWFAETLDIQDGRCYYCGCYLLPQYIQTDHAVPVVYGGTNEETNLVLACKSCNTTKGKRIIERWRVPWIVELPNGKTYIEVNDFGLKLIYEKPLGDNEFYVPTEMIDDMLDALTEAKRKRALGNIKQKRYN